jgi:hypothetical protein
MAPSAIPALDPRQERFVLLPDGSPQERLRAALTPESIVAALRTRAGLVSVQRALTSTYLPHIVGGIPLEAVAAALEELLGVLEPE